MVMRLKPTTKTITPNPYLHSSQAVAYSLTAPETIISNPVAHFLMAALVLVGLSAISPGAAIANPASSTDATTIAESSLPPEIDTSITREYEPAIIYLPDPTTQELVPQSVLVTSDAPAVMAVGQIVDAYEGQDVGITGYEVSVNPQQREAAINFAVEDERGGEVFQSLSSANQYSLFEAIRETLLTQPMYGVDEIIFQANDTEFNI